MSLTNSLKNAAYDNSVYVSRGTFNGITAAGSGGVSTKFVAHANLLLFGLNATQRRLVHPLTPLRSTTTVVPTARPSTLLLLSFR